MQTPSYIMICGFYNIPPEPLKNNLFCNIKSLDVPHRHRKHQRFEWQRIIV